ncbi:MAG: N-acetyltransferase [Terracidiphilus sp.]|jgi:ribosomal protein S18 acetylase RimI-like enzyme
MKYRLYKPEDFEAVYGIEELCFQPPMTFGRRYMRWLVQAQNAATWVAEDDGALTGFAIVEWTQAIHEISAYIQTIEVLPELRGQGVGGALLKHMEGSALAAGASTIWLHVDVGNFGAICLYETNGFLRSGDEENYYAPGRGAYVYRKQLKKGTSG